MLRPTAILLALLLPLAADAQTTDDVPPPRALEDGSTEVAELIVIARSPGRDPSSATTECLWEHLPTGQRSALTAVAEGAVRTLARHDDLPLANPALTEDAVIAALQACGGSDRPAAIPFARTALLAFAAENATARPLARDRIALPRLERGWTALTPRQKEVLLEASVLDDDEISDALGEELMPAIFKLLRVVRPVGVWNPLGYRNGTATHRVIYYYQAYSVRTAMERRF